MSSIIDEMTTFDYYVLFHSTRGMIHLHSIN